jgi:hypothetical protein
MRELASPSWQWTDLVKESSLLRGSGSPEPLQGMARVGLAGLGWASEAGHGGA